MGLFAGAAGLASAIGGGLAAAAPAIGGLTGAIGLGSTLAKTIGGSGASSAATNAQIDANNQAIGLNQPYHDAGVGALNQLNQFLTPGFDATSAIQNTPGYQFQYDQGLDAGNRAAAAAGTLNSGGTVKAQTRYGQGYAQNAYQNQLNNLYKVAGLGEFATNNMGNNLLNIGGAQAQNAVNQNGVIQNGLGGLLNSIGGLGGMSGGMISAAPATIGNPVGNWNPATTGNYSGVTFGGI